MHSKYMPQLDGLRFFAVAGVMIGHWLTYSAMTEVGPMLASCGVNLFFVLSGFLITQILIESKLTADRSHGFVLRQFYIRRFLRIFPLYYLVLVLGWMARVPANGTNFAWFFTYTTNIVIALKQGDCGYFSHLWSLAVEEQFYIIFPLVVLLVPYKKLPYAFVTMIVLGPVSRGVLFLLFRNNPLQPWLTYVSTPCCFDAFGIGAMLAYQKTTDAALLKKRLRKFMPFLGVLIGIIGLYFYSTHRPRLWLPISAFYRLGFCVFFFWVIGVASLNAFKGAAKRILENKVIIYLGKISYGIYVYHHFMPYIFEKAGVDQRIPSIAAKAALYFVGTVCISALSWHLFEKPINGLKKYFNYTPAEKPTEISYSYGSSK
jgi:peptidoglycan/LPS O-acetylase OafA/YrhL